MKSYPLDAPSYPFFTSRHDYTHIHYTHVFAWFPAVRQRNRPATKYRRLSINWCRDIWYTPLRKAVWKVALWAPHRRSAASRGGGGFDLVIACREEWEMSPGGDERTDLRQVGESTANLFCSGPTTAHKPPGPTWGWIVLAASLVLLDDVSAYFKRIGTFHRGKTFRRETKLHHRKNVSALRKKRGRGGVTPAAESDCIVEKRETRGRRLLYKKGFLDFRALRSKDNLSWTIRKDSWKDPSKEIVMISF